MGAFGARCAGSMRAGEDRGSNTLRQILNDPEGCPKARRPKDEGREGALKRGYSAPSQNSVSLYDRSLSYAGHCRQRRREQTTRER